MSCQLAQWYKNRSKIIGRTQIRWLFEYYGYCCFKKSGCYNSRVFTCNAMFDSKILRNWESCTSGSAYSWICWEYMTLYRWWYNQFGLWYPLWYWQNQWYYIQRQRWICWSKKCNSQSNIQYAILKTNSTSFSRNFNYHKSTIERESICISSCNKCEYTNSRKYSNTNSISVIPNDSSMEWCLFNLMNTSDNILMNTSSTSEWAFCWWSLCWFEYSPCWLMNVRRCCLYTRMNSMKWFGSRDE